MRQFISLAIGLLFSGQLLASVAEASTLIEMPREQCWDKLRDLSIAHHYVQGLTGTEITTDQKYGVGASRIVTHEVMGPMNETVTEWNEGYGFTFRLHRGEKDGPGAPINSAQFTYSLEERGEACKITLSMDYEMGWGFLGRWLDNWFLNAQLSDNNYKTAIALAHYYETGETVTPELLETLLENSR